MWSWNENEAFVADNARQTRLTDKPAECSGTAAGLSLVREGMDFGYIELMITLRFQEGNVTFRNLARFPLFEPEFNDFCDAGSCN